MWVAAVGLWVPACLGVVGATDDCIARAVGTHCTASEVDEVVTGCPATSTLVCMSGNLYCIVLSCMVNCTLDCTFL